MTRSLALLAAALLALGACRGGAASVPPGVRAGSPGPVTPAFGGMRSVLMDGARLRAAGDAATLRRLSPELTRHGLAVIKMTMPHDLRDGDVAHYLEGRAAFGEALKGWVRAVESGDDPRLFSAFDELLNTFWGWVDAYRGLPPERSV